MDPQPDDPEFFVGRRAMKPARDNRAADESLSAYSKDFQVDFKGKGAVDESQSTYSKDFQVDFKGDGAVDEYLSTYSKDFQVDFKGPRKDRTNSESSCLSLKSNYSKNYFIDFKQQSHHQKGRNKGVNDRRGPQRNTQLENIFQRLEETIRSFMKKELEKFFEILSTDDSECSVFMRDQDEEQQKNSEAFLKITHSFLRRLQQEELAQRLQNNIHYPGVCRRKLKSNLVHRFGCVYEGIAKAGSPSLLNQIYTTLHITEGGATEISFEHEPRHLDTASRSTPCPEAAISLQDVFSGPSHRQEPIRTVVTKGVAGVGKTVLTQKFILDWAEGRANQNIQLLFPFTFRDLNALRDTEFSLVGLVHHFFSETEKTRLHSFKHLKVLFILDGLDESRFPLNFSKTKAVTDTAERVSLDVLLVNLIRGHLLPSAHIWITTRPAAASQIPAGCVSMVTEVRGFSNPQKEEYFSKRISDEALASAIISHIKSSRSLYIMCQLPVFCWILSTVMLHVLKTGTIEHLPQTLTEMYIHFLVVQTKLRSLKYEGKDETDPHWNQETTRMMQSLGKLAFVQLQKGNLIFYESDLIKCELDPAAASMYSGVFTQVFKEESGLYQNKLYCFVHLSVQEFLAALYVHQTFINSGVNLLSEEQTSIRSMLFGHSSSEKFYQTAVDKMLESPTGHLDLFVRFLLGLSLPSNQDLLRGLVKRSSTTTKSPQKTAEYITLRLSEKLSVERTMSLFHCLNELKERSLVEQIQQHLSSGRTFKEALSPAQWSALVFVLLSSDNQEVFELKKYSSSEEALLQLLPVVKACSTALLSSCDLTERSGEALCLMFSSLSSPVRELDLSFNELKDSGLKLLALGLRSPHCRIQQLRVAGCQISEEGCLFLASALSSRPFPLTLLDLSYNHPGRLGVKHLSALQEAPHPRLHTLKLKPAGPQWLRPLIKYFTQFTLDASTAYRFIHLSKNNRRASHVKGDQGYPKHPDRFDSCPQLLCSSGLRGRAYWEVDWSGVVHISVSYRSITRRGNSAVCGFGLGPESWSLSCSRGRYSVTHGGKRTELPYSSSSSGRAAVYVDFLAGRLSFYAVSSDELVHLHTFSSTFTQPLFPGFQLLFESSVTLCDLLEEEPPYTA